MRIGLWIAVVAAGLAVALEGLYREGWVRANHPSTERFPVFGIDVSHHQGAIDWRAVASSGVRFAYIKATEGADLRDSRFEENWDGAARAGLVRGAYHFFTFCAPGSEQARNFLETVPAEPGDLPPVADVEFPGNCRGWTSVDEIRAELSVFLDEVGAAFGKAPVLYVTGESHRRIVAGSFPVHPLWVRDVLFEPSPSRYGALLFWQYADNGRVQGITELADLNVFAGRREEFEALLR